MSAMLISYRRADSVEVIVRIYDQLIQLLSYNPLGMCGRRLKTMTVRTKWPFPCRE